MTDMINRIALAITVCAVVLGAQNTDEQWTSQVRSLRPADLSRGENSVLDNLERRAKAALEAIPHVQTGEQADATRPVLRRKLEASLGFKRLPAADLEARIVGTLRRDGYRIEKIVYESLPGVSVPAHLYIPDALKAPAPAVLFYTGHWFGEGKSKADFQAFCINMARLGFIVMNFDIFGQGERGSSNRDHRRTEALVAGISQQGFAEYESRCALDYLLSRKDVDRNRIGMTGASGGGFNTWMTSALDDRIKVSVPVVGTSEFFEQIQVARGLDWYHANEHCHFVPGLIRFANNHELVSMVAPRPMMIIAASQDQSFPVTGVRQIASYAKDLYKAYGAPDKTAYSEDATAGHGYQVKKREAAYGWFLKWLMNRGDASPFPEPYTQTPPPYSAELRCFPVGENRPSGPGMVEAARRLAAGLPPRAAKPDFEAILGPLPQAPPLKVSLKDARVQRIEVESEQDLHVPAFLVRPESKLKGIVVAVDDRGKEKLAADPFLREAVTNGWALCGVDPRGIGELATSKMGWTAAVSLLLGENFVWRQAWDLTRVLDYLHAAEPRAAFSLYARGDNASHAAAYAVARLSGRNQQSLRWYALRDSFVTYRHFLDRPESLKASFALKGDPEYRTAAFDREIPFHYFGFGALRSFDIPSLLGSSAAQGVIVDPIDGDWKLLPAAAARKILPARVKVVVGEASKVLHELIR